MGNPHVQSVEFVRTVSDALAVDAEATANAQQAAKTSSYPGTRPRMNARQTRYFTGIDLRADIKADNPDEAQRRALACVRADDRVALVGVRLCGQGAEPIRNGSGYRVGLQVILELESRRSDASQAGGLRQPLKQNRAAGTSRSVCVPGAADRPGSECGYFGGIEQTARSPAVYRTSGQGQRHRANRERPHQSTTATCRKSALPPNCKPSCDPCFPLHNATRAPRVKIMSGSTRSWRICRANPE